jgi:hypothetical protein
MRTRAAVAQVVERSPEKAGVGGSTPSRGTIFPSTYGQQEEDPVTSCHKTILAPLEFVSISVRPIPPQNRRNPQPGRNQNSTDTDSRKGKVSEGGGA